MWEQLLNGGVFLEAMGQGSPPLQDIMVKPLAYAVVFTMIGLGLFGTAFLVMAKLCPFSIRKEIEEDQNTALGVLMGSVIIGIAIIVAAAIHG